MAETILRNDERIGYALRELYGSYGYSRFKMSKFEEYELYLQNKDFLAGDRMITFTGGDGTLLALKPDVTISIIKNTQGADAALRKVYYNENVYRAHRGEGPFREIVQTGLECIGDVDEYQMYEVILLAVKSLETISPDYMLDISHMGLVTGLMWSAGVPEEQYAKILACIREKNPTELEAAGKKLNLDQRGMALLQTLIDLYGDVASLLDVLEPYCTQPEAQKALAQLRTIQRLLSAAGLSRRVQLDFSVVNDMGYYNGIVFQGFVNGLSERVLSGGQYDKLVEKMGKDFSAIGFAITLNGLERLAPKANAYDVDVLLLYDVGSSLDEVARQSQSLTKKGKSVLVQKGAGTGIFAAETIDLRGKGEEK